MAKLLLNCVNETLKRASIINGDNGLLTTLTDGARQTFIDVAVQCWNEAIDDLYEAAEQPKPNGMAEATITLATGTRAYSLDAALNELYFPLLDETNGLYVTEYPGGYLQMIEDQPFPASYSGTPTMACIRPTDGLLYFDYAPTAEDDGSVYKYRYLKDLSMTSAADTVPFKDVVFRALVPAVTELWNRSQKKEFDGDLYKKYVGTAARHLNQVPFSSSWQPLRTPVGMDPCG